MAGRTQRRGLRGTRDASPHTANALRHSPTRPTTGPVEGTLIDSSVLGRDRVPRGRAPVLSGIGERPGADCPAMWKRRRS